MVLMVLLAADLPFPALAGMNVSLTWNASADTNVTGYNIYYGSDLSLSNTFPVGQVTSAVIPDVPSGSSYFIAAKAHNSAGLEGPFSAPVAFMGVETTPDGALKVPALPQNYSSDPLVYSLDSTAPPGATINSSSGVVSWTPGRAMASTTNLFNVNVTDPNNNALNISETMRVAVSDYLEFKLGTVAVSAGGITKIPLTVASSSSLTNIQLTINWPGVQLVNPVLTFYSPVVSGSLQKLNGQVVIRLQTSASKPLVGTNLVGQITFQASTAMPSSILNLQAAAASGKTSKGAAYSNVLMPSGQVVVVGSSPLVQLQKQANGGRAIGVYANKGTYQLQYTTSLAKPVTWKNLISYAQTNLAQTIALGSTNPVIYYRLHQL